jgi:hypothetical protein
MHYSITPLSPIIKPSLREVIVDIADALVTLDASQKMYKTYKPGVGPYSESVLVEEIKNSMNAGKYRTLVTTQRTPDLLIKGKWAIEFKLVRPFGDNGKEAENWSVNLLHPYKGNQSSLGDCLKLSSLKIDEKKAIIAICYEHTPPRIPVAPLLDSFELIAEKVMGISLSERVVETRKDLIHPVHQQLSVVGWEVFGVKAEKLA